MRTKIWTGTFTAVAMALAVGLAAQAPEQNAPAPRQNAPAPQQSAPAPQQERSSTSANMVTITGCVQAAAPSPTGTSGAAGAASAAADTRFQLTNAAPVRATPATGAGATAAAPPSAAMARTYRLDAEDAKLSPHVGKKVEISGTVEALAASGGSSTPAASAPSAPKLKVESVKMVAASCTE